MDIVEVCRTCMQFDDCMYSIYQSLPMESDVQQITPMDLFSMIPRLDVKIIDGMSTNICSKCFEDIMLIYNFILRCEQANKRLSQNMSNAKLDADEDVDLVEVIDVKADLVDLTDINDRSPIMHDSYGSSSNSGDLYSLFDYNNVSMENNFTVSDEMRPLFSQINKNNLNGHRKIKVEYSDDVEDDISPIIIAKTRDDDYEDDIKPIIAKTLNDEYQQSVTKSGVEISHHYQSYPLDVEIKIEKVEEVEIGEETIYKPEVQCQKKVKIRNKPRKSEPIELATRLSAPPLQQQLATYNQLQISETSSQAQDEDVLPLFGCALCEETFNEETSIHLHYLNVHPREKPRIFRSISVKDVRDIRGCFKCPKCAKMFNTERKLVGHLKGHSLLHYCEPCKKSFRNNSHLNAHRLRRHKINIKTKMSITCGLCDLRFAAQSELRQHQLVHTKERPYECPQCDTKYAYKKLLCDHLRQIHEMPENDLQRLMVEKYKAPSKLLGDTFECYICTLRVNRDDLVNHFKGHQQESVEKKRKVIEIRIGGQ